MPPPLPHQLDKDAVQLNSASNDCCCHIATSKKTVPLEKVQDVELNKDWIHIIFGLQQVRCTLTD